MLHIVRGWVELPVGTAVELKCVFNSGAATALDHHCGIGTGSSLTPSSTVLLMLPVVPQALL